MPSAANDSRKEPASSNNFKDSKSIWQQCHVGSNPTVCAKDSTLRGAAFYFCGKLYKGCKVGFEQPVPGALRPAGLQQSRGLLQGRGRIPPPAPSTPCPLNSESNLIHSPGGPLAKSKVFTYALTRV